MLGAPIDGWKRRWMLMRSRRWNEADWGRLVAGDRSGGGHVGVGEDGGGSGDCSDVDDEMTHGTEAAALGEAGDAGTSATENGTAVRHRTWRRRFGAAALGLERNGTPAALGQRRQRNEGSVNRGAALFIVPRVVCGRRTPRRRRLRAAHAHKAAAAAGTASRTRAWMR